MVATHAARLTAESRNHSPSVKIINVRSCSVAEFRQQADSVPNSGLVPRHPNLLGGFAAPGGERELHRTRFKFIESHQHRPHTRLTAAYCCRSQSAIVQQSIMWL